MAMKRRRRASVRANGRQGLWFRYGKFEASLVSSGGGSNLIYQNSIVTASMWRRDADDLTQPKRGPGGPLLSSLFGNFYFDGSNVPATSNPNLDMEVIIWEEAEGSPSITDDTSFYQKLDNEHILHYSYVVGRRDQDNETPFVMHNRIVKPFRLKGKTRLSGRVVMFAVRCGSIANDFSVRKLYGSVSGYITTP